MKCRRCRYLSRVDNPVIEGYCCITCKKTGTDHSKTCLKEEANIINFYKAEDLYGQFSNFYLRSIEVDGVTYPSSEHYYQTQKYPDNPDIVKSMMDTMNPGIVYKIAHDKNNSALYGRKDWNGKNENNENNEEPYKHIVMMKALRAKFTQHEDFKKMLLETGNKTLVEHTTRDKYWGDGGDGKGKNMLGKMLMIIRDELRTNTPI